MAQAPSAYHFGTIDDALVVRVSAGAQRSGGRRRSAAAAAQVYVVPLAVLQAFLLKGLSAADHQSLNDFFAARTEPKVEGAVVNTLVIRDGAS